MRLSRFPVFSSFDAFLGASRYVKIMQDHHLLQLTIISWTDKSL